MTHKAGLYYKNADPYYGPKNSYNNIPIFRDVKFETPVTIGIIEKFDSEESLYKEMTECKKQLSNLLLFSDEPKLNTVNDKYALPYYDKTYPDKILRIQILKKRIIQIRKLLNIPDENVEFYIRVNNNTFPQHADDILSHYNETYFKVEEKENAFNSINENLSSVNQLIKIKEPSYPLRIEEENKIK